MKSYFKPENRHNWKAILDNVKKKILEMGECELELRKIKKKPSDNQRGYYFSVILPVLLNHFGSEGGIDKLHEDIKSHIVDEFGLFTIETNSITGEEYKKPISLSDSKGDRENVRKFIEAVLLWASRDYGVIIPDPYIKI